MNDTQVLNRDEVLSVCNKYAEYAKDIGDTDGYRMALQIRTVLESKAVLELQKLFIYEVAGQQFRDTEPWGNGWAQAKHMAEQLHDPIYRIVYDRGASRREVYCAGGVFLSWEHADCAVTF